LSATVLQNSQEVVILRISIGYNLANIMFPDLNLGNYKNSCLVEIMQKKKEKE
jgi:hypothetical protein